MWVIHNIITPKYTLAKVIYALVNTNSLINIKRFKLILLSSFQYFKGQLSLFTHGKFHSLDKQGHQTKALP